MRIFNTRISISYIIKYYQAICRAAKPPWTSEGPLLLLSLEGSPSFAPLVGVVIRLLATRAGGPGFNSQAAGNISSLDVKIISSQISIYYANI